MAEPPVGRLLNKLDRVKSKSGGGWLARCPAHDDHDPSLSIDVKEGKVLLKCFVGCTPENIMGTLGLEMTDLFTDETPVKAPIPFNTRGRLPVAIYQYRDHDGRVVAEKGRFELPDGKKTFRWRPFGSEAWSGLEGAELPLTSLALWGAELVAESGPDDTVYFVEGEKAAAACREHGLVGVTFAGGASTKDFGDSLEILRGRKVALWPDNDPPGRTYMAMVDARLRGVAREIRAITVPLPPKGDAYDYFASGGIAEALEHNGIRLDGPAVEFLDDDAISVVLPTAAGILRFTFTEIEKTTRAFDAELTVSVEAPGYPAEPYAERVNILSSSAVTALRRDLENVYGKDLGWTRALNTALGTARQAYLSHDRSVDLFDIEDGNDDDLFLIDPLLPDDSLTIMFGDGASLKSFTAWSVAMHVALGLPFLGMPTKQGAVLVVDYEDNEKNFRRRMRRVARGMGLDDFPSKSIFYWSAKGIAMKDLVDALRKKIREGGVVLMIVDSVGPACGGKPEDSDVALAYCRAISKIGVATLNLAHITKDAIRRGDTSYPFGSVFWHNEARRTWYVARVQEEESDTLDIGLFCRKVNDGPKPRPVSINVTFEGKAGPITLRDQDISKVQELQQKRELKYQLSDSIARNGAATIKELALRVDATEGAVEKALERHKDIFAKQGIQSREGGGRGPAVWGRVERRFEQGV